MSTDKAVSDLLARLEAVTKRLESVEKQLAASGGAPSAASAAAGGSGDTNEPPFLAEFDDLVNQHVKQYVELSKKINDVVHQQALLFEQAVQAERKLLFTAANSKKPSAADLPKVVEPISKLMNQIGEIREKNRAHPNANHLSTVSEGVQALGWVVVSPTPGPHVNESKSQSEFWSNRILKDFKGKDELHVSWVQAFNGFLKDLIPYIKKNHTTELSWNPRGGDALSFAGGAAPAPSSGGAPPPPPGPPPPPPPTFDSAPAAPSGPNMGALFASLNKGDAVTSGLKKVTKDMKTKNQKDKPPAIVPASAAKEPTPSKASATKTEAPKPPVLRLEGNKWLVHHHINNKSIVIDETEAKQVVYVYKCEGSVVQVKGKVNNITLDSCKKTAVVFESVISAIEVVNSTSVEIQCAAKCPSYAVDKSSGIQLYLSSKEGLDMEFVQSKSSEMNILIPGETAQDDMVELPVPEQFKTVFKNGKLVTESMSHV